MKRKLTVLFALLLLLTGCAEEEDHAEEILQRYETMESCSMEAVVCCEYETERREYTLACDYTAGGESRVSVRKPEALQKISILYDGADTTLLYEDLVLDATALGKNRLSPAEILPRLMDAVKNGWLLEQTTLQ